MRASYKDRCVSLKTGRSTTEVHLKPGQFIFGRFAAASALQKTPSGTYKRLQKLKRMGNCNTQTFAHYTLVTVCNWQIYQNEKQK